MAWSWHFLRSFGARMNQRLGHRGFRCAPPPATIHGPSGADADPSTQTSVEYRNPPDQQSLFKSHHQRRWIASFVGSAPRTDPVASIFSETWSAQRTLRHWSAQRTLRLRHSSENRSIRINGERSHGLILRTKAV